MKYLAGEDILIIHSEVIDQTGGTHGIRDVGLFISLLERPRMTFDGKELYRGVFKKAAVYAESIAQHHVFVDGNKRTAVLACARFLYLNGYEIRAGNKHIEEFAIRIATKKLDLDAIAGWLKKHSRKLPNGKRKG